MTDSKDGDVFEHASPKPWSYHNDGRGHDWIEDKHNNVILENLGHIDGPLIVESVNARSATPPQEIPDDNFVEIPDTPEEQEAFKSLLKQMNDVSRLDKPISLRDVPTLIYRAHAALVDRHLRVLKLQRRVATPPQDTGELVEAVKAVLDDACDHPHLSTQSVIGNHYLQKLRAALSRAKGGK